MPLLNIFFTQLRLLSFGQKPVSFRNIKHCVLLYCISLVKVKSLYFLTGQCNGLTMEKKKQSVKWVNLVTPNLLGT